MPLFSTRLLIELSVALAASVGFYFAWLHHDHVEQNIGQQKIIQADKAASVKQKVIDDQKLKEATNAHQKELENLKNAYLNSTGTPKRVMCYYASSGVSAANIHDSTSSTSIVVQDNSGVYRERAAAFELLFKRADGLSP